MVLHYAQEIFEGLKAYRRPDGSVATFRPEKNGARFQASSRRLGMPELPVDTFIEACDALVRQDEKWVPAHGGEESLYLRPFMIATEVGLGVKPANEYLFPSSPPRPAPYFPGGVKPVSIWVSEDRVRAVPGGMGDAKTGGNYAASLLAQAGVTARDAAAAGRAAGHPARDRRGHARVDAHAGLMCPGAGRTCRSCRPRTPLRPERPRPQTPDGLRLAVDPGLF
ncbi:Branched-chain-amino-acid aminotransferase [Streptomyces violaceorubidus]